MSEDQFTKLFQYMQKRFDSIDKQFEENRRDHSDIRAAVGELSAQVKGYHEEVMALTHQLDKLREAILQIARETGVKLQVEL
ncbi:MAG TPA: hypothetical protein VLG37_01870 [Candidatus Saccharimonadales bacterium]|nr:hypothetical protein [Candidatus Saccharimonadales bacterium]